MKKQIIIIIAALAVSLSALAYGGYRYFFAEKTPQQPLEKRADLFAIQELISVIKPFQEAKTLDAEFTTVLIGSDKTTDMGSFRGRYVKDSMHLYVRSIASENILNKDFFVAIDHSERMMFVERTGLDTREAVNFFRFGFLSDLDSLVNLPDSSVLYEKLDDKTARLSMEWPTSHYYRTELIYDTKTKMLRRLHLYPYQDIFLEETEGEIGASASTFAEAPVGTKATTDEDIPEYIAIVYDNIKLNEPVDQKWFDVSKYFRTENKKLIATKSYKHYEIDFE